MGKEQIEFNLKRRMLTETGWVYFCRICGNYLNEDQFYKSKSSPFKIDTKCRLHYTKKNVDDDSSMNYLKLDPLSDEDFKGAQRLLETLGYEFGMDTPPIWKQFNIRHNLDGIQED
jgi:hypothetical protein